MDEYDIIFDKKTNKTEKTITNTYKFDISGFLYQKINYSKIDFYAAEHPIETREGTSSVTIHQRRKDTVDFDFIGCVDNFRVTSANEIISNSIVTNFQNETFNVQKKYVRVSENLFLCETKSTIPYLAYPSYCDSFFNLIGYNKIKIEKDNYSRIRKITELNNDESDGHYMVFNYDINGQVASDSTFESENHTIVWSNDYTYDANGKINSRRYFESEYNKKIVYLYEYNEEGYLYRMTGSKGESTRTTEYIYEYY